MNNEVPVVCVCVCESVRVSECGVCTTTCLYFDVPHYLQIY